MIANPFEPPSNEGSDAPTNDSCEGVPLVHDDGRQTVTFVERARLLLAVLGPGLLVCLADSDIGGLLTMAMAGSTFGYSLIFMQVMLVPVLYLTQEMVVRLSLARRQGLVVLTREELGTLPAIALTIAMCLVGFCAIISEFTGIVAAGELFNLSLFPSSAIAVVILVLSVMHGDYRKVELVALLFGAGLLVFVVAAVLCQPPWGEVFLHTVKPPNLMESGRLRELVVANVGTVVTPWMLFFQGSALIEKRLTVDHLPTAQIDTLVGSIVTQVIMASVLVVFAKLAPGLELGELSLEDIFLMPMQSLLNDKVARVLLALGLLGSSLLATLVISLGIAWNLIECWFEGSLDKGKDVTSMLYFRYIFVGIVVLSATVVILIGESISIAELNIVIQVLNGFIMPPVVACVFILATTKGVLPNDVRVRGLHALLVGTIILVCSALALLLALAPLFPKLVT